MHVLLASNVHYKLIMDGIVAWHVFSDVYVDEDVRFGSAESDTQAWM